MTAKKQLTKKQITTHTVGISMICVVNSIFVAYAVMVFIQKLDIIAILNVIPLSFIYWLCIDHFKYLKTQKKQLSLSSP